MFRFNSNNSLQAYRVTLCLVLSKLQAQNGLLVTLIYFDISVRVACFCLASHYFILSYLNCFLE